MAGGKTHIKISKFIKPETPVHEIATIGDGLVFCDSGARAADVLSLMLHKGIRRVPVVDKASGILKGIISTTDMIDFLGAGDMHELFRKKKVGLDIKAAGLMKTDAHSVDKDQDISTAVSLIRNHKVGGLPVTSKGKLVGFISEIDIIRRINGRLGIKVSDVMRSKPFFVKERFPVIDVAKIMVHGPYRRLPVVKDGILVGVVTPFDILKSLNKRRMLRGLQTDHTPIWKVMNPNVLYTKPKSSLTDAIGIMQRRHVGGLPVVKGDEMDICGIITERDVIDLLE
jgi:predicted transcriptional regulator